MKDWTEPVGHWEPAIDVESHARRVAAHSAHIGQWPPEEFETTPTDCYRSAGEYWLMQAGVGAVRFLEERPEFFAYPDHRADFNWFHRVVRNSWMPAVYQIWRRQVIHAAAVVHVATRRLILLVGSTGTGKSTLAYGLGREPGWQMIADDTLAFACDDGRVDFFPIRQYARLRRQTAAFYGKDGAHEEPIRWLPGPLVLGRLYFLELSDEDRPQFRPISGPESYGRLLKQAFALSLDLPAHNQRLMLDYTALAAAPGYALAYRRSFDTIAGVLHDLAAHALTD